MSARSDEVGEVPPVSTVTADGEVLSVGSVVELHPDSSVVREAFESTDYSWNGRMSSMLGSEFEVLELPSLPGQPGIVGLPSPTGSEDRVWLFPAAAVRRKSEGLSSEGDSRRAMHSETSRRSMTSLRSLSEEASELRPPELRPPETAPLSARETPELRLPAPLELRTPELRPPEPVVSEPAPASAHGRGPKPVPQRHLSRIPVARAVGCIVAAAFLFRAGLAAGAVGTDGPGALLQVIFIRMRAVFWSVRRVTKSGDLAVTSAAVWRARVSH